MHKPRLSLSVLFLFPLLVFGQLQLNEVMSWNTETDAGQGYQGYPDWIEILNQGETTLNLKGWSLSDEPETPDKWSFGEAQFLKGGKLLVVFADEFDFELHTNFALRSKGEWLGLFRPDGSLADSLTLPAMPRDLSYGRDQAGQWHWFMEATPGEKNVRTPFAQIASPPQFSQTGGNYTQAFSLELSHPDPTARIVYTTDGNDPDSSSATYTVSIPITSISLVKTRAYVPDQVPSEILTHTFWVNAPHENLPVLSISTPPLNLWDDRYGIYVTGTNGIKGNGPQSDPPRNWNQDWERPVFLEYYDRAGEAQIRQEAGIKIYGGWSRGHPQKSLSVFARKEYGNNRFAYPLYRERPFDTYKSFVLRNSGNDWIASGGVMLRDGFQQSLISGFLDIDKQAYEPSILYLNGRYWGIHNMREKLTETYLHQHHLVDRDKIDLLTFESTIVYGHNQRYLDLLSHVRSNSMINAFHYAQVQREVDLREFMDYQIFQIFINNQDWPGNNIKFWRGHQPGAKWRWLIYDTDFGFGIWNFRSIDNTVAFAMNANGPGWPNPPWSTLMLRRLMINPQFQEQFLQRFVTHLNFGFHPDRTTHVLDSLSNRIDPEMEAHGDRWNGTSLAGWRSQVLGMKSFATFRPGYVRDHLRNYFSRGQVVAQHLAQPDSAFGQVWENEIALPVNYRGEYFSQLPIPWEARPKAGFQFVGWQEYDRPAGTGGRVKVSQSGAQVWQGERSTERWVEAHFTPLDLMIAKLFLPDSGQTRIPYIDLYNPLAEPLVVGGYRLTGTLQTVLPAGLTIPPHESLRLTPEPMAYSEWLTHEVPLPFSADELSLGLFHPAGMLIDSVDVDAASWPPLHHLTLKHPQLSNAFGNNWQVATDSLRYHFAPLYGTVLINELCSDAENGYQDEEGETADWIELYNPNSYDVPLGGWFLSDDTTDLFRYQIPLNAPFATSIPAYGYLRFWADGDSMAGPLHLPFKLNKAGETLTLSEPGGWQVDRVELAPLQADESWGRFPDGTDDWLRVPLQAITPGGPNVAHNTPPVFVELPQDDLTVEVGRYFEFSLRTEDKEDDTRWLEVLAAPEWVLFSDYYDGNGRIAGTPGKEQVGTHFFQFRVWDGYKHSASLLTFTLTVPDPLLTAVLEKPRYEGILYPNPTEGPIEYIVQVEGEEALQLTVRDVKGQTVWSRTETAEEGLLMRNFDLGMLPGGLYLFEVRKGEAIVDLHKVVVY